MAKAVISAMDVVARNWDRPYANWLIALAEECDRHGSRSSCAKRIGYSPAVVSQVLSNSYQGNLKNVADRIRGALLGENVSCPLLGEIPRDECLDHQKQAFSASSSLKVQLYLACRNDCPNSRLGGSPTLEDNDDPSRHQ